jgi:hypothetical protein
MLRRLEASDNRAPTGDECVRRRRGARLTEELPVVHVDFIGQQLADGGPVNGVDRMDHGGERAAGIRNRHRSSPSRKDSQTLGRLHGRTAKASMAGAASD